MERRRNEEKRHSGLGMLILRRDVEVMVVDLVLHVQDESTRVGSRVRITVGAGPALLPARILSYTDSFTSTDMPFKRC